MMKTLLIFIAIGVSLYATEFKEASQAYQKGAYIQAFNDFYILAKEGDKLAQHNVGMMYSLGKGAKKDSAKAISWYEKAAKQGLGVSAYNLGEIYQKRGKKDPHAYTKAKYWYEKAIEEKVKEAYNNLATLYINGYGVIKDIPKALKLLEKAAALDNAKAQVNVAVLYAWGEGITHNKMKAYENLKKALSAGESEASGYLDKLCQESAWVCKD